MNNNVDGAETLGNNEINNDLQGGYKFQRKQLRLFLLSALVLLLVLLAGFVFLESEDKLFKAAEKTKSTAKDLKNNTSLEKKNDVATSSASVTITSNQSAKTNTPQNSQTKELGTVEQTLLINDPVENQATISIDSGDTLIKDVEIALIHPDGRRIEIPPVDVKTSIQYTYEKKSFQEQQERSTIFALSPSDPLVAPLPGEWAVRVTAPVGTHLVFGVVQV